VLPDDVATAHAAAVQRVEDTYRDPATGLRVMTAATLARRGHCCGCGCRHCPYPPAEQARAGRPGSEGRM
jgi:hypothetical protein